MNFITITLISVYVFLSAGGLIVFKMGSNKIFQFGLSQSDLKIQVNLMVLLGLVMYIGSFLIYTVVISKFDLSYIFPLCTGLVYILVLLASKYILKETMILSQYLGGALILAGVVIMNIKGK